MKLLPVEPFIDFVSRKLVYFWKDSNGRTWMAYGPWSLFRVSFDYFPPVETPSAYELERMYKK